MKVLVTGSSGLIGSQAVEHFDRQGHEIFGVDNNMRQVFFGPAGDTLWNLQRLQNTCKRFTHAAIDIRDRAAIEDLFTTQRFDLIVHCAAQPSHDKARDIPLLDFEVNALGTVNLLEATTAALPRRRVRLLEHQQSLWRRPQRNPAEGAGHPLRLRAPRRLTTASTKPAASIAPCTRSSALPKPPLISWRRNTVATST